MKKLIDQILKFGVVGFIAFFIDFGIFKLLSSVFGVYYLVANFFGFTIALIFNYVASMTFVFERKENADRKAEFLIFTVLSVVGLGLNELIIYVCIEEIYLHIPALTALMSRQWAETFGKIVATGIVMVYNFITRKIFLEKKE
ncbi:MAG: GtrA family protein [Lachnospiraceae bacterium]|jgi:putative flippase GtrA|nr:GtrA family protein [Lachnospiraceae bacterium]